VTRYVVWLPDGSRTCETSREVSAVLRDYGTGHPEDPQFDRVSIEEIGDGWTEVGPLRSPEEFLEEPVDAEPSAAGPRHTAPSGDR
jgi:hypothetical protein